jgi:hypothetical protein
MFREFAWVEQASSCRIQHPAGFSRARKPHIHSQSMFAMKAPRFGEDAQNNRLEAVAPQPTTPSPFVQAAPKAALSRSISPK